MVLTRAQTKTTTVGEPAKRPSARGATASSKARTKPKEEIVKAKTKVEPIKSTAKDEPAQATSKEESARSRAKAASKARVTTVSSRPKPDAAKPKRVADSKPKIEEPQTKSRRGVSTKPPIVKATAKTIRKPLSNKIKQQEKPQTPPEPTLPESTEVEKVTPVKPTSIPKLQQSPTKNIPFSPTKALSPIKLSGSTILQTPRRSEAIRSAVKKLPIENPIAETPHHNASTLHESPRRGNTIRAAAIKIAASEMLPMNESPKSGFKSGLQSSLASFKLLGTPMRRGIGSVQVPKTVSVFSPRKRPALETPIRPKSAQGEKRLKIVTPMRPQTADVLPSSCMKREFTISKKSVTFENFIPEISPIQNRDSQQIQVMTPITEKSGERSSLSFGALDSFKSPEPTDPSRIVLNGLIFYLDVWGSDGSSANQYFEPLLEDMGAKISSEWSDEVTHVLFKDGKSTTLQRVTQTGVHCVNVGWAVDCELRQTRLPENDYQYAIDLGLEQDTSPRTPLRLVNSNAAAPMLAKTPGTIMFGAKLQALRDAYPKVKSPNFDKENWESPASTVTPLFQKSCPPKQTNRTIFEQDPTTNLKKALFKASRKSTGAALKMTWDEE